MTEVDIMSRLLAVITLIFLFPSYLISFLPCFEDRDFTVIGDSEADGYITVNGESVAADKAVDPSTGTVTFDFGTLKCGRFNYFAIKYKSDAYIKGKITYTLKAEKYTEEFFLEPTADAGTFRSFIDGCLENQKAYRLHSVTFEPLDKDTMDFELLGVGVFNREVPDDNVYIKNDELKLGVDLNWGGALSYLEDLNSDVQAVRKDGRVYVDSNAAERYGVKSINNKVNLINRYDAGRLVQQSYYGTSGGDYECGEYNGNQWNYNPVQGGNKYNECSKIVDIIAENGSLYVKCRPLDWAKTSAESSPSYMEATYTLDAGVVKVSCRFVDFSGYPSASTTQEMPAFYCIEPFNRFVYYSDDKPWQNDSNLTYENELIFWPDAGYPNFYSTENWAAFIGEFDDSFGIGLYVPHEVGFLAGVYNRETTKEKDPSKDCATSYIAAVETMEFASFKPVEYKYCITTGTTAEIRENFEKIKGDF